FSVIFRLLSSLVCPPCLPLFPYTTLFRSDAGDAGRRAHRPAAAAGGGCAPRREGGRCGRGGGGGGGHSETLFRRVQSIWAIPRPMVRARTSVDIVAAYPMRSLTKAFWYTIVPSTWVELFGPPPVMTMTSLNSSSALETVPR